MAESHKIKNRVIFTLLVVILIMVTAIVVLAYNNDYGHKPGHSSDGRFRVEFTSIAEHERNGEATSRFAPYYVGTNAYFHVDFVKPGDFMTYVIQVLMQYTLSSYSALYQLDLSKTGKEKN